VARAQLGLAIRVQGCRGQPGAGLRRINRRTGPIDRLRQQVGAARVRNADRLGSIWTVRPVEEEIRVPLRRRRGLVRAVEIAIGDGQLKALPSARFAGLSIRLAHGLAGEARGGFDLTHRRATVGIDLVTVVALFTRVDVRVTAAWRACLRDASCAATRGLLRAGLGAARAVA